MRKYPRRIIYEIGQRYHSFIIIESAPTVKTDYGRTYTCWKCKCDCGIEFTTTTKQIQKGVRKSCGCLSKANQWKGLSTKDLVVNLKFGHYQNSAKRRGLTWNLSKKQFENLILSNCFYCNSPPILRVKRNGRDMLINGIDRKENLIGYEEYNSVPCCHFCNTAKLNYGFEEFLNWIERIKNAKDSSDK